MLSWGKLGKEFLGYLCVISDNNMCINKHLKIKFNFKKHRENISSTLFYRGIETLSSYRK